MKLHRPHRTPLVLALGTLLLAASASLGDEQERVPIATTPHFAFYSDFAVNLNDALLTAGEARRRVRPELFKSGPEKDCFYELPVAERVAWDRAVDFYAEVILPSGTFGREQTLVRKDLADLAEDPGGAEDRRLVMIAGSFRAAAAPAYKGCRWATQNAENRRWIEQMITQLALHEETIAPTLARLYERPWHGLPIPTDVVETVDRTGASTLNLDPDGEHILISNSYEGAAALEIIFHEGSHTLIDPVWRTLNETAEALAQPTPEDLWHVVLFYTTGESVRRILDEAGEPGYTPLLYEIFERGSSWGRYREAIESIWPAYLDGERTLSEAATDLIQALDEPDDRP